MTTITLSTVWLSAADNPSDYMAFPMMAALSENDPVRGRKQSVAGGGVRTILQAGRRRSWSLDLPNCSRVQLDWLTAHPGKTLCARDPFGHKFFCDYFDAPISWHGYDLDGDTAVELSETTVSESV